MIMIIHIDFDDKSSIGSIVSIMYKNFMLYNSKDASESLVKHYQKHYGPSCDMDMVVNRFKETSDSILAAVENGLIVGFLRSNRNKIINLYIDSSFHGKGFARALVNSFLAMTHIKSYDFVFLKSSSYARPFYEKIGFVQKEDGYLYFPLK